jgi:hypothetical protein
MPVGFDPESGVKHFWAFPVWNYAAERVQILQLNQATIRDQIHNLYTIEEYGEPSGYDIVITRTGEKLSTEYNVQALPPKPVSASISAAYRRMTIDLDALFNGGNPFGEADVEDIFDEEAPIQQPSKLTPPSSLRRK